MPRRDLNQADYRTLLDLRTRLRAFLHWSEQQARTAGLTAAQHQLLLAVRGHVDARGPTIGELADYLYLRHHSAVGLVDRADQAGLVRRVEDPADRRVVRVALTDAGSRALRRLSHLHIEELTRLASHVRPLLDGLELGQDDHGGSRTGG
ncbi:MAG TPA: MarR family transcriptional regulator [Acidimicrobiales bacterium]|nr:MarR family transcriptional regulator [Acidimicrobiales bacterium]